MLLKAISDVSAGFLFYMKSSGYLIYSYESDNVKKVEILDLKGNALHAYAIFSI